MLNKVQLIGFLGADPTSVHPGTRGRSARALALRKPEEERRKAEKTECTTSVLRKLGEIVGEHLKKGSLVYVEGHLQTRPWDKEGETRYSTEIIADAMKMLPGGGKGRDEPSLPKPAQKGKSRSNYDDGPF